MKDFRILFLLLPSIIVSQEIDEAYLESLPDDVRSEVMEKIEAKELVEMPVYRRASTFIDKEEEDIEKSKIFGSNFFDTIQSSFMPVNEPNLDPSYVIDFGDVLKIQLIGQENSIETYSISRDGSINIPDIGKLVLSGLSLSEASKFIKAKIKNVYIGTEAFISLENIRDINILIVGNAYNPGIYTLNGNSNLLHALNMAGGLNEYGSFRKIDLIRDGEVLESLDIYKLLVFGEHNLSLGLRSGDTIVVNSVGDIISVETGTKRTGKFEIKDGETFKDVLNFANGFNSNADISSIRINRVINGEVEVQNYSINDFYDLELINNDSIYIKEYKIKSVRIQGEINEPGNYLIDEDVKLSDLIKIAGGYSDRAYPFGGYLDNKKAAEVNELSKQKLYNTFINNYLLNFRGASSDSSEMELILNQIRETPTSGRVIAEFDIDILEAKPQLDTMLEDGDIITIPPITQQVYIQGQVSNPGAVRYSPNKDIKHYLKTSGGTLDNADIKNIFIVHPNGETININNRVSLAYLREDNDVNLIYPGSIIYVPQSTNFANSLEIASVWAPIIGSLALSLTSLSVLNNN